MLAATLQCGLASATAPVLALRSRIVLMCTDSKTNVTVTDSSGSPGRRTSVAHRFVEQHSPGLATTPARRTAHDHRRADRGGRGADPGGGAPGPRTGPAELTRRSALADHDPPYLAGFRAQTLARGGVQDLHRPVPDHKVRGVVVLYLAPPATRRVLRRREAADPGAEQPPRCCRWSQARERNMPTAPGRPGTARLTVASSRAKHAHETLPVGHYTPQEARQAFAEAVVKAHGLTGAASTCATLLSASLEGLLLVPGLPAVDKSVEERLSGQDGYARHRACCRGSHVDRRARAGGPACAGRASQGRARRGSRASGAAGTALDRTTEQLGNGSAHPQLTRGNALREACALATQALPAQTARRIARKALIPLEFRGLSVHAPVHAKSFT